MIESDGPGGAETVVRTLADGYREAGHDVFPVVHAGGPGWLSDELRRKGFDVYQPQLRWPVDPISLWQYIAWLRAKRITRCHTHEFTTSFYGGLASRLLGIPYVITMHGGVGYSRALRRRVALSAVARGAKSVVGVSGATATALSAAVGISPNLVRVVPNGVTTIAGARDRGRMVLRGERDTMLILSVGNLYEVKGHDVLVEAAALLAQVADIPEWHIFIAGRGEREYSLAAQIERHGLANRVTLLGLRSDVPDLLAAADLFVMPSRSEGLPMAVLEAMLAEVPVVCTDVGGLPELIGEDEFGFLVTPNSPSQLAERILFALRNREIAQAKALRAKRMAHSRFSSQAMTVSYLDLLSCTGA